MATLGQKWQFARHIPFSKLCARGIIIMRRRLETRFPPKLNSIAQRTPTPPQPIFIPRKANVIRDADSWEFGFLGHSERMADSINWHQDGENPTTQLWQMNLHYMEYLETLDATDCLTLMRSWIAANPPFTKRSWHDAWNSYTVSLRSVIWMQRIAQAPALAQPDIIESLTQQILFLENHLELDLGGNHLIKNIKALIWASAFFEGSIANRWRVLGTALLKQEVARQILADGVHYERSPSYHAQVFADLVEIRHALGDKADGAVIDGSLTAMAKAVLALSHPDGGPALFNDAGLHMAYSPAECAQAYTLVTGKLTSKPQHFAFDDAGYFGVHNPSYSLITDMGRIGPDDLPAHAHGDIGSFELSVGAQRVIVDQGVYEYVEGSKRNQSRATLSHNCLTIAGVSQADFFGAFRCGVRPDVTVTEYRETADGFKLSGYHDGYPNALVSRSFTAKEECVEIRDHVKGDNCEPVEIGLLIHPDCTINLTGKTAAIACGRHNILISADFDWIAEPAVYWPDMGVEVQAQRLRLTLPPSCRESSIAIQILPVNNQEIA